MASVAEFPYFEVEFDKNGDVFNQAEVDTLTSFLAQNPVTDLVVLSHGWNDDMIDARVLYSRLLECVRSVIESNAVPGVNARQFAVMAVLWPSKKFAQKQLIPGGAAGATSPVTNDSIREQLDILVDLFDDPNATSTIDRAKNLVPSLEDSPKARAQFAELLKSLLSQDSADPLDGSTHLFKLLGGEIMDRLSKPVVPEGAAGSTGGSAAMIGDIPPGPGGSAAGFGDLFAGIKSGARNLANLITYYQMKDRAGIVGSKGVNPVLRAIRTQSPGLKLHLVGHSFGCRLLTAAAVGQADQPPIEPCTMTLLQAAFSHYGFALHYDGQQDGYFRKMVSDRMVSGPVLISCTVNDLAVGLAYPLMSLLAGQVAASLGDKNDIHGGMGRNGAQKTPEASDGTLLPVGGQYQFAGGKLYNLNADKIIGGHSDICHNEVAYALLTAIAAT